MQYSPEWVATAEGPADLSRVRTALQRVLAECEVPDRVVDDAMLVATELLTNAFEHGSATAVRVHAGLADGHVVVETAHDDTAGFETVPIPGELQPPAPTAMRGRGLLLVQAVSAWFERFVDPGGQWRNRVGLVLPD